MTLSSPIDFGPLACTSGASVCGCTSGTSPYSTEHVVVVGDRGMARCTA
jgi:hypothetical protein